MTRRVNNPEAQVQILVVEWFRRLYPQYLIFSVPNEATYQRSPYYKLLGMLPGVSDIVMVLKNKVFFLEFKAPKNGRLSDHQCIFKTHVELLGFEYHVIRDLQDVKSILKNNLPLEEWKDL